MQQKRYSVEQIVAKARGPEKLQAQGLTIVQACKRLGISDQTFFRSECETDRASWLVSTELWQRDLGDTPTAGGRLRRTRTWGTARARPVPEAD